MYTEFANSLLPQECYLNGEISVDLLWSEIHYRYIGFDYLERERRNLLPASVSEKTVGEVPSWHRVKATLKQASNLFNRRTIGAKDAQAGDYLPKSRCII